jgi:hypothetical protein
MNLAVAERKKYLREGVLFSGGVIIPRIQTENRHPCRRSKNKPRRPGPLVSHGSLPTVRASAATLSAALTLRPRASLATIYETAPNIRSRCARPHHAETLKLSCGMLSVGRQSKLKIGLDRG